MKKSLKKLLRGLWLVCLGAMPLCIVSEAFAATQYTKGDFTYSYVVGSGEAKLYSYSGSDSSVHIPSSFTVKVGTYNDGLDKFETFRVTGIYCGAFKNNKTLTSVSWPSSVKTIDGTWAMEGADRDRGGAFQGCTNLQDIPSLSGITSIGLSAFQGCASLTSVEVPSSVTYLGESAFQGCTGLKTAVVNCSGIVPSGLFAGCTSLESLVLGDGIVGIEGEFRGYVTYAPRPLSGCNNLKSVSLGRGITAIPNEFVYGLSLLERVTSSGTVEIIGNYAFYNCANLIEFPNLSAVTTIGSSAFYGCSKIETLQFGENLKSIGERAFYNCTDAFTFAFAGAPPNVGSSAFYNVKNGAVGTYTAEHAAAWDAAIDSSGYWKGLKMRPSYITLSASDGSVPGGIEVTWTDGGCEQYELFRGESENGTFTSIAVVSGNTYFDSSAKWGQPYWYYVNRVSGQKGTTPTDGIQRDSTVDEGFAKSGGELPKIEDVDVGELWLSGEGPYYCFLKWNDFDKERYYVSSISFNLKRSESRVPVWASAPKVSLEDGNQIEVFDVSQNGAFIVPRGAHGQYLLEVTWEVAEKADHAVLAKDKQPCKKPCVCNDVKVFFHKYEIDDGITPNWFRYWRNDGALKPIVEVYGNTSGRFHYDKSCGDHTLGRCKQPIFGYYVDAKTPPRFPKLIRLYGIGFPTGRHSSYALGINAASHGWIINANTVHGYTALKEIGSNEVGLKNVGAVIAHELMHGKINERTYGGYTQRDWLFIEGSTNTIHVESIMVLKEVMDAGGIAESHKDYYNTIVRAMDDGQYVTDLDGDGIADVDETGLYATWGFRRSNPDTYGLKAFDKTYATYGDNEILARDAEKYWNQHVGNEYNDWAWPGYNVTDMDFGFEREGRRESLTRSVMMSLDSVKWRGFEPYVTAAAQKINRRTKGDMSVAIQSTQKGVGILSLKSGSTKLDEDEIVVDDSFENVKSWHGMESSLSEFSISTGDVYSVSCIDSGVLRDETGRIASLGWSLALTNATDEVMSVKLFCHLTDGATNALAWVATNVECAVGLTTVEMRFDAEDIFLWDTSRLMLYAVTIESSVGDIGWMVSEQTPCALTAAEYSAADIANDKGRIVPSSVAVIVTSEGVMVTGEVVRVSGDAAQIYSSLIDANGLTVTSAMIDAPGGGTNDFAIFFPGDELYRLAKPLPYVVDSLRLVENGVTVHEISAAGTVDVEDARWFRPSDLTIHAIAGSGAWSEPQRGADGLCSQITYSFVVSNAEDTVKACHARATLLGTNEEHVCSLNLPVELAAGLNTVSMSFSSIDMKAHEYDGGVYRIGDVFVESDDGNEIEVLHTDGNSIAVARSELAGTPFTVKGAPQFCYREAGGTNLASVVVTVDVARPDTITASVLLVDGEGKYVATARTSETVGVAGGRTLTLTFNSAEVKASGLHGPYTISYLLLKSGNEGVEDVRIEDFVVSDVLYLEQVASPVFAPATKTVFFRNGQPIAISCATTAAEIRYTLDGSEPTETSALYDGSLTISSNATVKAKAFAEGLLPSETVQAEYIHAKIVGENLVQNTSPEAGATQTVSVPAPGTYQVSFDYSQGGDIELRLLKDGEVHTLAAISADTAGTTNILFDVAAAGDYELTVFDMSSGSLQPAEVSELSIAIPGTPENRGRYWICETEKTYGSTGEWTGNEGFRDGKIPIRGTSEFTPYTPSSGSNITITTTVEFKVAEHLDVSCIQDSIMALAMGLDETGKNVFKVMTIEQGVKVFKNVHAEGMGSPETGTPYTFKIATDTSNRTYSVTLISNEGEKPLTDGTSGVFAFCRSSSSEIKIIEYSGYGELVSLLGSCGTATSVFAEGDTLRISGGTVDMNLTDGQARWLNSMGAYDAIKAKAGGMEMEDFMVAYLLNLDLTKDGTLIPENPG